MKYLNKILIEWDNQDINNQSDKNLINVTGDNLDSIPWPSDETIEMLVEQNIIGGFSDEKEMNEYIQTILDELTEIFKTGTNYVNFINDCRRKWFENLADADIDFIDTYGPEIMLPDAILDQSRGKYKDKINQNQKITVGLLHSNDDIWGQCTGIIWIQVYNNEFGIEDPIVINKEILDLI